MKTENIILSGARRFERLSRLVLVVGILLINLAVLEAQTPPKRRILLYGPCLHDPFTEVNFINGHPAEFEPVQTGTPGKSAIWNEQQWINATTADFQQFDAIVLSDQGTSDPNWCVPLANRSTWSAAVNGNVFITSGDPINDGFERVFRQGVRFAANWTGTKTTGLYIALDHIQTGEQIAGVSYPTKIPILSGLGNFTSVQLNSSSLTRLVSANAFLNALDADVMGYSGSTGQGFHSWPANFFPIAYRAFDPNPTPSSVFTTYYEADTGYELCSGTRPLVYMLARCVSVQNLQKIEPWSSNMGLLTTQPCWFTVWSTFREVNCCGSPIRWQVISGPNAGLSGTTTLAMDQNHVPLWYWQGSYSCNPANVTSGNFQDVVRVFQDFNNNGIFDDFANNNSGGDPTTTIDFGATFTVNWGTRRAYINPFDSTAGEPTDTGTFRVGRSDAISTESLIVTLCFAGTANGDPGNGPVDYFLTLPGGASVPIVGGEATITIPAGTSFLNVTVNPVNDGTVEGPETIRASLKDGDLSYVVNGNGFVSINLNDDDRPIVTVTKITDASEASPTPGTWRISTTSPLVGDVPVLFTFSGGAEKDVDYLTSLNENGTGDDQFLSSGTGFVTLRPGRSTVDVQLFALQDSRTEGGESAVLTLRDHPGFTKGTPFSASIIIASDDTAKVPVNGYAIVEVGDASHNFPLARGLNNLSTPAVVGDFFNGQSLLRGFRWANSIFTDLPPIPQLGPTATERLSAKAVNDFGLVVGAGESRLSPSIFNEYYFLWNNGSTLQLTTPATANLELGPFAINNQGHIVGTTSDNVGVYQPVWWDLTGAHFLLGTLDGNDAYAYAVGSKSAGVVVAGEGQISESCVPGIVLFRAFRTQPGSDPVPLSVLTDDLGNGLTNKLGWSGAYAVNSLGEIVGYSAFTLTENRAAYKDGNSGKDRGWKFLGVLPGGTGAGQSSCALGINDLGVSVGWSRTTLTGDGARRAVVWDNSAVPAAVNLNTKLSAADQSHWVLQQATAVNAGGKIVGVGLKDGVQRSFLLTPNP